MIKFINILIIILTIFLIILIIFIIITINSIKLIFKTLSDNSISKNNSPT